MFIQYIPLIFPEKPESFRKIFFFAKYFGSNFLTEKEYGILAVSESWLNSSVTNAEVVVIEMVLLALSNSQNCIKSTNKIPEYAREYKKEYLFIRGINKEFKYFVDNLDDATRGLFESHKVDRIKYFIKRFLRGQERGKLRDISEFEIEENDVDNLIKIKKIFNNFNQFINYRLEYEDKDDDFYNPYPGFKNIYGDFELFFSKLKIKYKYVYEYDSDSDSDSDSDIEDLNILYTDSDIGDFSIILRNLVSVSVSDSDSDSDSDIF